MMRLRSSPGSWRSMLLGVVDVDFVVACSIIVSLLFLSLVVVDDR